MNAYVAKPFKQEDLFHEIHAVIEKKTGKQISIPSDLEELPVIVNNKKYIDLSYLDELSGGRADNDFKREMIDLFVQKVPTDLLLLEKAIHEKEYNGIKRITHDMKSSLSMFRLEKEVKYLEEIEKSINISTFNGELTSEFDIFKHELILVIDTLSHSDYALI